MIIEKINDRTVKVHFELQRQTVFYYTGFLDPDILANNSDAVHVCLVRFPKPAPKLYFPVKTRKSSNQTKQMFAYLDHKHVELTGQPFPRKQVFLFVDPTDGKVCSRLDFFSDFYAKHSKNFEQTFTEVWYAPAGVLRGELSKGKLTVYDA